VSTAQAPLERWNICVAHTLPFGVQVESSAQERVQKEMVTLPWYAYPVHAKPAGQSRAASSQTTEHSPEMSVRHALLSQARASEQAVPVAAPPGLVGTQCGSTLEPTKKT
jgi:hypothetical protein